MISDANQHPLKALKINKQNNLVEYFSGSAVKIGKKKNRNLRNLKFSSKIFEYFKVFKTKKLYHKF